MTKSKDTFTMADNNQSSYPSPDAVQGGNAAMYHSRLQESDQNDLDNLSHLRMATAPDQDHQNSLLDSQLHTPRQDPNINPVMYTTADYQGQPIPGVLAPGSGDETSARKKTKVSRACDECRRKKIRCDASNDAADSPNPPKCSNCVRTSAICQFSRQPQKRGPSKGYIKDLAERVASLESERLALAGETASPVANNLAAYGTTGMKRSFSMSTGDVTAVQGYDTSSTYGYGQGYAASAQQQQPFANMHYTGQNANANEGVNEAGQTGIAEPEGVATEHTLDQTADAADQQPTAISNVKIGDSVPSFLMDPATNISSDILDNYWLKLHPVLSLFGQHDERRMLSYLSEPEHRSLVEAYISALTAATDYRSVDPATVHDFFASSDLLIYGSLAAKTFEVSIVYLQLIALVLITMEVSGPTWPSGLVVSRANLMNSARNISARLGLRETTAASFSGNSLVAYELARRAWFIISVVHDWNTISTGSEPMDYTSGPSLNMATDVISLGPGLTYSKRVSEYCNIFSDEVKHMDLADPHKRMAVGRQMQYYFALVNDYPFDAEYKPLVLLSHQSLLFLSECLKGPGPSPGPTPTMLHASTAVVASLSLWTIPHPLMHHFVVPVAYTLLRGIDYAETRVECLDLLRKLLRAVIERRLLTGNGWEHYVVHAIESKLAGGAVEPEEPKIEWGAVLKKGFLTAFGEKFVLDFTKSLSVKRIAAGDDLL